MFSLFNLFISSLKNSISVFIALRSSNVVSPPSPSTLLTNWSFNRFWSSKSWTSPILSLFIVSRSEINSSFFCSNRSHLRCNFTFESRASFKTLIISSALSIDSGKFWISSSWNRSAWYSRNWRVMEIVVSSSPLSLKFPSLSRFVSPFRAPNQIIAAIGMPLKAVLFSPAKNAYSFCKSKVAKSFLCGANCFSSIFSTRFACELCVLHICASCWYISGNAEPWGV